MLAGHLVGVGHCSGLQRSVWALIMVYEADIRTICIDFLSIKKMNGVLLSVPMGTSCHLCFALGSIMYIVSEVSQQELSSTLRMGCQWHPLVSDQGSATQ